MELKGYWDSSVTIADSCSLIVPPLTSTLVLPLVNLQISVSLLVRAQMPNLVSDSGLKFYATEVRPPAPTRVPNTEGSSHLNLVGPKRASKTGRQVYEVSESLFGSVLFEDTLETI